MKKILICLLAMLCTLSVSAQKSKKLEEKARTYAEKYERSGDELTISFVADNLPLSRQQIFGKFPKLLVQQFKVNEEDIEARDALSGTMKTSITDKVFNSGSSIMKSRLDIKLAAKEGKARISIRIKDYTHFRGKNVIGEEVIVSRPPFKEIAFNDAKSAKATEVYSEAFLELDRQIEGLLQSFNEFWTNGGK